MVINTFHRQPFLVFLELPAITESVGLNVVEYEYLLLHFVFLVNIYNKYDCTRKQSSSAIIKRTKLCSLILFFRYRHCEGPGVGVRNDINIWDLDCSWKCEKLILQRLSRVHTLLSQEKYKFLY